MGSDQWRESRDGWIRYVDGRPQMFMADGLWIANSLRRGFMPHVGRARDLDDAARQIDAALEREREACRG